MSEESAKLSGVYERALRMGALAEDHTVHVSTLVAALYAPEEPETALGGRWSQTDHLVRQVMNSADQFAEPGTADVAHVLLALLIQRVPDALSMFRTYGVDPEDLLARTLEELNLSIGALPELVDDELPGTADVPPMPLDQLPQGIAEAFDVELVRLATMPTGWWDEAQSWLIRANENWQMSPSEESSLSAHLDREVLRIEGENDRSAAVRDPEMERPIGAGTLRRDDPTGES